MRKVILALSMVLVLSSFTTTENKTIVLNDIDGTLLKSAPVVEQVDNGYVVTFTVDAATVVLTNVEGNQTMINLVELGSTGTTVTHKVTFQAGKLVFDNFMKGTADEVSLDGLTTTMYEKQKPTLTMI